MSSIGVSEGSRVFQEFRKLLGSRIPREGLFVVNMVPLGNRAREKFEESCFVKIRDLSMSQIHDSSPNERLSGLQITYRPSQSVARIASLRSRSFRITSLCECYQERIIQPVQSELIDILIDRFPMLVLLEGHGASHGFKFWEAERHKAHDVGFRLCCGTPRVQHRASQPVGLGLQGAGGR
jgi:hypothetical protein